MIKQKKLWDNILTVIMALLCLLWIYPIVLILLNSLKKEGTFTTSTVFQLPTRETFAGLSNYVYGVIKMGFLSSLGYSLVITVSSVALILLCCSTLYGAGSDATQVSSAERSRSSSPPDLRKLGISPVKHSPRSWIRHIRITLSMSSAGNSSRRKSAVSASRQLCSATLSRRPPEV